MDKKILELDLEKRKKRQSVKVIVSEAIMVFAVIAMVTVLAFIVSGYWINSDFEVERQGMLQIYSTPTGANVNIDGEASSWLQRTNTSKVLAAGEHTVTLTKDGYDSWSKTIEIKEGLLYRLHYPRLFLQERTPEKLFELDTTGMVAVSSDHDALLITNNTTRWNYLNLDADKPKLEPIDISPYFSSVSLAEDAKTGLFTGEVLDADWDYDDAHVLFKVKNEDVIEWVLLDVKNPKKSVNITKEFGVDFSRIEILDNSSSNLIAIQGGNMHKIDVSGRHISAVLVEDVADFDHYDNEVVFSADYSSDVDVKISESFEDDDIESAEYYLGYYKVGDEEPTILSTLATPAKVTISKFYDDKYITVMQEEKVEIFKKEGFSKYAEYELGYPLENIEVGRDGVFTTIYTKGQIATIDMEAGKLIEWSVEGDDFGWIDNNMVYTVVDGDLIVYDYDGLNRRVLGHNISTHFPASITENKWLYYVSDDYLMREVIAE